jgi:hypothetical protein
MTYPPVTQFETQAREAEAQAGLAHERQAAGTLNRTADRWQRVMKWLPFASPGARAAERAPFVRLQLKDCEQ